MHNINTRTLDLNLLVVFATLWETQNVTRASERLALSQPAVSHALRRLRERLGDELFVTGRSGLVPTARAAELIGPVRDALMRLDDVLQGSEPFLPAAAKRKFRIASGDFVEFLILPRLIQHIAREAPGVMIEVVPLPPASTVAPLLERGDIDLVISTPMTLAASLRHEPITTVSLLTLIWEREGLAPGRFPLELYLERPQVMIEMHQREGNIIDTTLKAQGLARRIGVLVQNFMAMPVIASQTGYICNLPGPIARVFAHTFGLSCHEPPVDFPAPELVAYWHSRFDTDPGLKWLRERIKDCAIP
ncbi:LysR family transcriptional regulator [Pseudomonas sp. JQ170]|uniref:LysR family transcriptional regulator n=1 Tax=unclassified Pseudomonas TaxID=196821 RepID=UPI0026547ECA|nr:MULTISPECIES: LysR family transcriptional regulator [unclassified Pseudomonas]MDN7143181.1 LysR family transcriptional regulator [Pseudomonas sp. JQ170]WRO74430.1 LysR family transcriptional regulator [Pseudomonas sp. 170C]